MPLHDETDLLARVAEGNDRAFGKIFHHYRPKIYSYAYQLFGNIQMADELVQEVFLKVWLNRDKLPHILKFDSWLFIIARNQVFDMLKLLAKETTARQQMARFLDPEANFVEDRIIDKENEVRLRDALDHLSPQQKLIFTLSRQQGLKHEEIASQLNISRNTVKTHLVHALKTLRDILHFHSDSALLLLLSLWSIC
ncbi:MAG TPA: RNA polymerase sigma-70 factor [Puia sp.]|nr:RNA polymerase sigma-70 factor [Puia sp.]